MAKSGIILLGAAAVLLLASSKKKRSINNKKAIDKDQEEIIDNDLEAPTEKIEENPSKAIKEEQNKINNFLMNFENNVKATQGKMYQIKAGDTPLDVASEALFGDREELNDPYKVDHILDFLERMECSPWNQFNYGVSPDLLDEDHASYVSERYIQKGISFDPIYSDNRSRMNAKLSPTNNPGKNFAYIYIPKINDRKLLEENIVSLEGMNWPDTIDGIGHSMIDPPKEILDLGLDSNNPPSKVGCIFPEGDFQRTLEGKAD